ncbi:MFS drug efflux transporter [Botrytis cinerea]
MTALIFGRVIRGGTGMYLGALTLISVNTSPKETIEYMEYFALVWGFGSVIEPLVRGAFTDSSATLRWVGFVVDALTDTYILIYAAAALSLVLSVFFTVCLPRIHRILSTYSQAVFLLMTVLYPKKLW